MMLEQVKSKPGRPKKTDREKIKELCLQHSPTAVTVLKGVMTKSKSPAARVAAAKEILDRGIGKVAQPLAKDLDNPLDNPFEQMMALIAGKQAPVIRE